MPFVIDSLKPSGLSTAPITYMLRNALLVHLIRYSDKNKKGRKQITLQKIRGTAHAMIITFIMHGITHGPDTILIPTLENLGKETQSRIRAISILTSEIAQFKPREIEIECRGAGHGDPSWPSRGNDIKAPNGIMVVNVLVRR